MSAFTEFLCIAIALYLWESTLWLPLRGVVFRRRWFSKTWKPLDPGGLFAAREVGMVAMWPLIPDVSLAPCQSPPLIPLKNGTFLLEIGAGVRNIFNSLTWNDISEENNRLTVGGFKTRISSRRCIGALRRAKERGQDPAAGIRSAWKSAWSPSRARLESRRWNRVSRPLRWYGVMLTVGSFAGLPLAYIYLGVLPMIVLVIWLWLVMAATAVHVWWLGHRVYPDARGAFTMDALLCLLVPFHAMRAMEIASVHAFATTNPVALLLSTRDLGNPWLSQFARRILHPLPADAADIKHCEAVREPLERILSEAGAVLTDYDRAPDRSDDADSVCYCPRCHGKYEMAPESCPDCPGIVPRPF